jgi:hypothetical protein
MFIIRTSCQNINKDVDLFKVKLTDMPFCVSSTHMSESKLRPPWGQYNNIKV